MNNRSSLLSLGLWLFLTFIITAPSFGQQVYGKPDIWLLWQNSYQINKKWSIETEFHARFDNYWQQPEQLLFRPSVNYQYQKNISFAAGYSYIHTFPYGEFPLAAEKPEHNIWQQAKFLHKINRIQFSHRLRLEQRFQSKWENAQNRYTFQQVQYGHRFRYRFSVQIPISEKWSAQVFDEVWIKTGASLSQIDFDRNWWSVGIGYQCTPQVKIALSYLHQYIKHDSNLFEQHHTAQLTLKTKLIHKTKEA